MAILRIPQSKVSRHLSYLRASGLVESRRDKLWMYYSLAKPRNEFHKRLISCLGHCLDEAPVLKNDLKKLKIQSCRVKGCA
jgi:ArsR family transcriptional regulator